ncbi:DUF2877 domain-containing protein [Propionibacteriaceae bacterium G57]|uniref:oxamate carbamoyltransferase subunit AllH family protein n=1 Tax=Aestuariimicrobium sp. G57 TaxID=3418485 RepID=UPI003DA75B01
MISTTSVPGLVRLQGSVAAQAVPDLAGVCRVLAVFEHAAYLLFDHRHDAVVALLRPGALQLPIGVRLPGHTPDLRHLVDVGAVGEVAAGRLRIGALDVGLSGRHRPIGVRVRVTGVVPARGIAARLGADPVLRARARQLAAAITAQQLQRELRGAPDHRAAHEQLAALIGWGRGLTPSGDDLVCGVLLALVAAGRLRTDEAEGLLANQLHRTTSLSARLLRCAAAGLGVPQVVRLVDASFDASFDVATPGAATIAAVHAIGHSSGRDLCAGLAGALDHLSDPRSPTR